MKGETHLLVATVTITCTRGYTIPLSLDDSLLVVVTVIHCSQGVARCHPYHMR
jgi:hypothetical protein